MAVSQIHDEMLSVGAELADPAPHERIQSGECAELPDPAPHERIQNGEDAELPDPAPHGVIFVGQITLEIEQRILKGKVPNRSLPSQTHPLSEAGDRQERVRSVTDRAELAVRHSTDRDGSVRPDLSFSH